jgi:hypothetical protein
MAFQFPAAPTVDQIVQDPTTGAIYQWKTPAGGGAPYAWYALNAGPGVPDPPLDGEYVRVGNLWRLKSQTLNLSGIVSSVGVAILVPAAARGVKFSGTMSLGNNATGIEPMLRVSIDGTTYVTATEYTCSGVYWPSLSPPTAAPILPTSYNHAKLGITTATASLHARFDGAMSLVKTTSLIQGRSSGSSAQTGGHYNSLFQWFLNVGSLLAAPAVRGLQFGAFGISVAMVDSYVDLEWVY